jgi:putative ABC transport system substrate-binding protein
MRRRDAFKLLGGAAAASSVISRAARAQQGGRIRRIGIYVNFAADDPEVQNRIAAFAQGLQESGWSVGRNLRIDYRYGGFNIDRIRKEAADMVALRPEVVMANGQTIVEAIQAADPSLPVVFTGAIDPVGSGMVASMARPGGTVTGFIVMEYGLSGKWLELLKQIAPRVTRVAVLRDRTGAGGPGQYAAIQAVAPAFGVELRPIDPGNRDEMERTLAVFAREANGGLIITSSGFTSLNRDLVIALAARHRLPAVYPFRHFAAAGGLISYGTDQIDQWRLAAGYVDRILRGTKPADLPVQLPVKYETVLNLKTAKALGLDVPAQVLVRADEVIE